MSRRQTASDPRRVATPSRKGTRAKMQLRILYLEDDPRDAELIQEALTTEGITAQVTRVDTRADFAALLEQDSFDLIFSDNALPSFDGPSALALAQAKRPAVPFIFVSGTIGEEAAIESLKSGATDYVLKQRLTRLGPVVRRAIHEAGERVERQRAEENLRRSENRFRALIENSTDAVVLLESAEKILYASPSTRRILGYSNEELSSLKWPEPIHPDDRDRITELITEGTRTPGQVINSEARVLHKDGSWRWLQGTAVNLLSDPNVQAIVVNFRDITGRKRVERGQAALLELSQALLGELDTDAVMEHAIALTADILQPDLCQILLLDKQGERLSLRAGRGWQLEQIGKTTVPIGLESQAGYALMTHQPVVVEDSVRETRFRITSLREHNAASGIAAPMLTGKRALGVLGVHWRTPRQFREDEVRLLALIANQTGVALEKARLFAETERRLHHLTALRSIDMAITGSIDLRLTLSVLLDQVIAQLPVDAAAVLLLNPHNQELQYGAERGFRSHSIRGVRLRLGEPLAGQAALERRLVSANDLAEAPAHFAVLLANEQFVAYYGVPLIAKGQVQGVLEVFHRTPLDPDQEWLDFLEAFADQAAIAIDNAQLFDGLQRANANLTLAYDATIEGWSRALDLRDKETEGHTQRVTELALRLAGVMGFSEAELVHVRRGGLLHDIGKMGVPDRVLLKPEPLTEEEWVVMRKHPEYAYELLSPIAYLRPVLDIPHYHHEKWDGTGYPRGLKGEQIPLVARIFAVVDVWDALRSDRPYRPAWTEEKAREYIRLQTGTHFDPEVVDSFLRLLDAER